MAVRHVDIIVKRSRKIACKNRLRRPQVLSRELERGPVTLRVPLLMYRASEKQNRQVGRAWVVDCRTPDAVAYFRHRLKELMRELDGIVVVAVEPGRPARISPTLDRRGDGLALRRTRD